MTKRDTILKSKALAIEMRDDYINNGTLLSWLQWDRLTKVIETLDSMAEQEKPVHILQKGYYQAIKTGDIWELQNDSTWFRKWSSKTISGLENVPDNLVYLGFIWHNEWVDKR